jgi:predicted MFS family arabinose efflux permease
LAGLALGGLIYGPFTAISTALFQHSTPPQALSRVLAARTALTTPATALGTLLGGPVVAAVGGRQTLLISALLTIALGAAVAAALRLTGRGRHPARTNPDPAVAAAPVAGGNA